MIPYKTAIYDTRCPDCKMWLRRDQHHQCSGDTIYDAFLTDDEVAVIMDAVYAAHPAMKPIVKFMKTFKIKGTEELCFAAMTLFDVVNPVVTLISTTEVEIRQYPQRYINRSNTCFFKPYQLTRIEGTDIDLKIYTNFDSSIAILDADTFHGLHQAMISVGS